MTVTAKRRETQKKTKPAATKTAKKSTKPKSQTKKVNGNKTWQEKLLNSAGLPKIQKIGKSLRDTLVIPSPLDVDEIMRSVKKGKIITIAEIRQKLADKYNTTSACALCTGIFARIAAEAAEERRKLGLKNITPYWRTLKSGGFLNEKFPGGIEELIEKLKEEGHEVIRKGQTYIVEGVDKAVAMTRNTPVKDKTTKKATIKPTKKTAKKAPASKTRNTPTKAKPAAKTKAASRTKAAPARRPAPKSTPRKPQKRAPRR